MGERNRQRGEVKADLHISAQRFGLRLRTLGARQAEEFSLRACACSIRIQYLFTQQAYKSVTISRAGDSLHAESEPVHRGLRPSQARIVAQPTVEWSTIAYHHIRVGSVGQHTHTALVELAGR